MLNQSNRKEVKEISAERGKRPAASLESLSFFKVSFDCYYLFFTLAERILRFFFLFSAAQIEAKISCNTWISSKVKSVVSHLKDVILWQRALHEMHLQSPLTLLWHSLKSFHKKGVFDIRQYKWAIVLKNDFISCAK